VAASVRREGDDVASRRLHFSLMAPVHFFVTARDFQEQLCVLLIFGYVDMHNNSIIIL
jgi:hypothetical protein